ncbi:hypothetical protein Syun_030719 [Stephania yunnanensis]|uniref:Uncharacterized protein n=1 Tax=Stephania yunnanensis TaxID=152371 RepID=A0AAP0HER0_9MAGN
MEESEEMSDSSSRASRLARLVGRRRLHLHRFGSHFSHRLDGAKQFLENALLSHFPRSWRRHRHHSSFAFLSSHHQHHRPNHAFDLALTPNFVANTLSGTSVYTVSNSKLGVAGDCRHPRQSTTAVRPVPTAHSSLCSQCPSEFLAE